MPSVSNKQRMAMAIAAHQPSKLVAKNRGMLSMTKDQLHDFASGPVKKKTKVAARLASMKDPIDK